MTGRTSVSKTIAAPLESSECLKRERGKILNLLLRCLTPWLIPVAILVIWEVWANAHAGLLLPPPSRVFTALGGLIANGVLFEHIGASLQRVAAGFLLAVGIGVPLGLAIGYSTWFARLFGPLVDGLRPIPASAWVPISIILMGIGERPAIFLVFIGTVWTVIINAGHGVKSVPKHLVWAARTMGASRSQIFFKVIFPAALPSIFMAMRVAVGVAFTNVIVAELIAVRSGLGYMITEARLVMRPEVVVAGMVAIGVVGYLLDLLVRLAMARALRWQSGLVAEGTK
jgi:NitT/TauT family transport system permease protein